MNIWTFWEPRTSMPQYLKLCLKTWHRYLSEDDEIHVLDYSNIREYIDLSEYGEGLFDGRYSLPKIADAIRALLLYKHGGLWLDLDTIMLDDSVQGYFNEKEDKVVFFGDKNSKTVHLAIIYAPPASKCMKAWAEYCKTLIKSNKPSTSWDDMGNAFINPYIKANLNEIKIFDAAKHKPEYLHKPLGLNVAEAYQEFYFNKGWNLRDMGTNMLILHNSWTPAVYKKISENEFMKSDCTMSNVLAEALGLEREKKSLISFQLLERKYIDKENDKKRAESYNQEIVFLGDKIGFNSRGNVDNDIRNDIFIPAKNSNFNFYRYNIPKGLKEFYIKISGVSAKFDEYTAGIFDFKNSKILRYETCKVSGEHVFHFLVGKSIDNIALCIYAGITRHTAGNEMRIKELAIMYRNYPG